jgi:hypothetical protein
MNINGDTLSATSSALFCLEKNDGQHAIQPLKKITKAQVQNLGWQTSIPELFFLLWPKRARLPILAHLGLFLLFWFFYSISSFHFFIGFFNFIL